MRCARSVFRQIHPAQRVRLLFENQLGAGRAGAGHQHERADLLVTLRGQHRDRRAFAVTRHRDAILVDVLPLVGQISDDRAEIFRVIGQRRRLHAPAALADAALVVAHDEIPRVGQRIRELREDRNARDGFIAIDEARSRAPARSPAASPACPFPCPSRPPAAAARRRLRHGRGQIESVGEHAHVFVVRAERRLLTRRHHRDIVAHDLDLRLRDRHAHQVIAIVRPHLDRDRSARILRRQLVMLRLERARRRLHALGRHAVERDGNLRLRRDVRAHRRARLQRREPRDHRFVRAEDVVRQQNRRLGDVVRHRLLLSS